MRILVFSDVHANLNALETVLAQAGPVDAAWCLGDVVGYGPDPNACIERIRALPNLTCLLGNHDAAALGRIPLQAFNNEARQSILWLQGVLTPESRAFLEERPETAVHGEVTLAHGSPRNPVWEYVLDRFAALANFEHFDTPFCFVGHSHLPQVFTLTGAGRLQQQILETGAPLSLMDRAILNPGSVGQPRDRDNRAAYGVYDDQQHTWLQCRAAYDIASVQKRILEAGLPAHHAARLLEGW